MPPLKVIAALRQRLHARRERRWIRELLTYDDHLLTDLGFSRETLLWALKLPPGVNAAAILGDLN